MEAIDYSLLRTLTARRFVSAVQRDGFILERQKGSHQHYRHPDGRRVTVAFHRASDTFPPKTLRTMIEDQARWSASDLIRLGLIDLPDFWYQSN
jgi:predicted RNA binding protein YcfA (HicA-like mRNA interferase family)